MNLLAVRPVYICETGFDPNMKEVRIWMNLKNVHWYDCISDYIL